MDRRAFSRSSKASRSLDARTWSLDTARIVYYTIQYLTTLHYTLYYTILYTILYYTTLYYTILYYTILYYTILYYTILYYTILYYTILHYSLATSRSDLTPKPGPGLAPFSAVCQPPEALTLADFQTTAKTSSSGVRPWFWILGIRKGCMI